MYLQILGSFHLTSGLMCDIHRPSVYFIIQKKEGCNRTPLVYLLVTLDQLIAHPLLLHLLLMRLLTLMFQHRYSI